ncbi:MAG: hypothetical protein R2874_13395 [Desulfobacterales bacterium]
MTQVIETVDFLKENNMLDCLQLLHYHLGSQIPNIRDIRFAVVEACRVYAGLVDEGAPMGYLDLGGGLAVDYDGSHTNFTSSRNYTLDEYCADIIEVIMGTLDDQGIPIPPSSPNPAGPWWRIIPVLLFNIIDVSSFETLPLPEQFSEDTRNDHQPHGSLENTHPQKHAGVFNDALYYPG